MENTPCRVFLWCFLKVQETKADLKRGCLPAYSPGVKKKKVPPGILETRNSSAVSLDCPLLTRNLGTLSPAKSQSPNARYEAVRSVGGRASLLQVVPLLWFLVSNSHPEGGLAGGPRPREERRVLGQEHPRSVAGMALLLFVEQTHPRLL